MPFKSKEQQQKYLAEYRKKNKTKLLNRRKRRVMCACGTICSWNSLGRHRKTKFHTTYEERNGGKTIKEFKELNQCIVLDTDSDSEEEETNENVIVKKPTASGIAEKPIWKQYCKQCGNAIECHSIKRLISCGLVDNSKTIEFLKANIKN